MPINTLLQRGLILTLIMVGIMFAMFTTPSQVHADGEYGPLISGEGRTLTASDNNRVCTYQIPSVATYTITASFTNNPVDFPDNVCNALDGIFSSARWTSYGSGSLSETFTIDFGSNKDVSQIKLYVYSDNGGVRPPASYNIQYWDGDGNTDADWINATNQSKNPISPTAVQYNVGLVTDPSPILNTVNFDTVNSQKVRVVFTNSISPAAYTGLVEIEVYNNHPLISTLARANAMYNVAVEGPGIGQYISGSKAALATAIGIAQGVVDGGGTNIALGEAKAALETAIIAFEASKVVPVESHHSAFLNSDRNSITLYVSNMIDASYGLNVNNILITNGSDVATINNILLNELKNTIEITLTGSLPSGFHMNLQEGAYRTTSNILSASSSNLPLIQVSQLDLNNSGLFEINDLVVIVNSNSALNDINNSGAVDSVDRKILLEQIQRFTPVTNE